MATQGRMKGCDIRPDTTTHTLGAPLPLPRQQQMSRAVTVDQLSVLCTWLGRTCLTLENKTVLGHTRNTWYTRECGRV